MIQAYEGDYDKERYVVDTHKNMFVYGWGYCDTFSRIAEAAWRDYKRDPRAAERVITQHEDGGYHTMFRLRLDGHYGAFDARYGYYLIDRDAPDARVLDWAEVGVDENILRNKTFRNRCRPFFEIAGIEWERAPGRPARMVRYGRPVAQGRRPQGKRLRQQPEPHGHALPRHGFPPAQRHHYRALLG